MTVCIDTNVLVQLFGQRQVGRPIRMALLDAALTLAVSNEILLEYEELITRLSGRERWQQVEHFLTTVYNLNGNIRFIEPHFRFPLITNDPDDNKSADCAIAAEVDHIITADRDFNVMIDSGYKPQPITPENFIARYVRPAT